MTRVAIVRDGRSEPEVLEVELPEVTGHLVRVRISSSGLCRSQLNQIAAAASRTGPWARLLGHEAIGVVQAVGTEVTRAAVGDTVLVSWVPRSDGSRSRTPEGVEFEAPGVGLLSARDVFTWADETVCDEAYVIPVDLPLDPKLAIVGCAVFTGAGAIKNSLEVVSGQAVGVVGVGGVGLSAVAAARCLGAATIVAVDLDDAKLELARSLGATHTVNSSHPDAAERIWELTGGVGIDAVADCVSLPSTIALSLSLLRKGRTGVGRGGRLAVVGVPSRPVELDLREVQLNEWDIRGSFGGSTIVEHDIGIYLEWVRSGAYGLSAQVTDVYPFDRLLEGVCDLDAGRILGRAIVTLP